jgi:hypothetical protein
MFEHVKVECTKGSFRIPIPKAVGVRTRGVNWLELSAGQSKVLRWDQAAAVFGFPQARDEGKRKNRTDMHRQLRLMWGFHEGYDSETEALKGQYSSWEAKRPNFRVTTLDGAYIPMVLDDPEGLLPIPNEDGSMNPSAALGGGVDSSIKDQMLAKALAQIEELRAQVAGIAASRPIDTDDASLPQPPADETVTVDGPTAPPVRSRGRQTVPA